MSFHRENVIWKDRNNKWNIGFYTCYETGNPSDDDHDEEWDVDYDFSTFDWASGGHNSLEAAVSAWRGANPGGGEMHDEPSVETDELDKMLQAYQTRKA